MYTYEGSSTIYVDTLSRIFQAGPGATFESEMRIGGLSADDASAIGILHELSLPVRNEEL